MENWKLINLKTISDDRGILNFIETGKEVPFEIKRLYYLHGVPSHAERGHHAHKTLQQMMIALAGSFEVNLNDGFKTEKICLDKKNKGILIRQMVWRELGSFTPDAICLVIASEIYEESDYIRSYEQYRKMIDL